MRTQELRRLREERARHMQQLEELEDTRNRLAKMQAKVEDLQAQLETKAKVERYLQTYNQPTLTIFAIHWRSRSTCSLSTFYRIVHV